MAYPGFSGTKSAQIPARKENADWTSASDAPQAETHSWTVLMKSGDGQ